MKTLTLLLTLTVMSLGQPVLAEMMHGMDHAAHAKAGDMDGGAVADLSGDVHVNVNGLVCDFCAQALNKTFGKYEEVKAINVNLETKIVTVNFNDDKTLDDATITKIITDAGYNVEKIHRVE